MTSVNTLFFVKANEKLSKEEEKQCKSAVRRFLRGDCSELNVGCDMRKIQLCFNLLKHSVQQQKRTVEKENNSTLYEELLRQKDEEIRKTIFCRGLFNKWFIVKFRNSERNFGRKPIQ